MGKFVCQGAVLQCSCGMAPATLNVINPMGPTAQNLAMATIMDFAPVTNIPTFGMCTTQVNPAVAAATAAAMGTPTPAPCMPAITSPWTPGSQVMVCNKPALLDNARCMCAYMGQITITSPGNMMVEGK